MFSQQTLRAFSVRQAVWSWDAAVKETDTASALTKLVLQCDECKLCVMKYFNNPSGAASYYIERYTRDSHNKYTRG